MPVEEKVNAARIFVFGPFALFEAERRLERDGINLKIGSRAFELLLALVGSVERVVTKGELVAKAWQGLTVDEGNLRFQIGALRRLLGDAGAETKYLATVQGRGYSFVAPVSADVVTLANDCPISRVSTPPRLPPKLSRLVGRDAVIQPLCDLLLEQRFVSIVGPGGIGKTAVALAVAHHLIDTFGPLIYFVDLSRLNNPAGIYDYVADTLELSPKGDNALPDLLRFFSERPALLILDCCEHVTAEVADLAEEVFKKVPAAHILTTSRESLRTEGERVCHLAPLACPPENSRPTIASALEFAAVQLFVERMRAAGHDQEIQDEEASIISEICRRVDGIALALELAAGRVKAFGIRGTADLLDSQFHLLCHGRRTAVARHQTLSATLDWSYRLLTHAERTVLCRLSAFTSPFTLEAATSLAAEGDLSRELVLLAIENLAAKSLVMVDVSRCVARYRLFDATRAYVRRMRSDTEHSGKSRRARMSENRSCALSRCSDKRAVGEMRHSGPTPLIYDPLIGRRPPIPPIFTN
jgi:predicted ATPase/DNA-binding winged helix-turn-helix (wHTH) protein